MTTNEFRKFRESFLTEIGTDIYQRISLRELLDLVICAGKDATIQDLLSLRPYAPLDEEIFTFEEAFAIFREVPDTTKIGIFEMLRFFKIEGTKKLNYDTMLDFFKNHTVDPEVIEWLMVKKRYKADIEDIFLEIDNCKSHLHNLNAQIIDQEEIDQINAARQGQNEQTKQQKKSSIFLLGSSNESLSSIFSQTNRKFTGTTDINDSTNIKSAAVATEGKLNINVKVKGLVIQKSRFLTSTIAYHFKIEKTKKIRVALAVNEIDSFTSRFHNSLIGYLVSHTEIRTKICGVTTRRQNHNVVITEWIQLKPGNYSFFTQFCHTLKNTAPERHNQIINEDTRKLTKPFKVMLMNLFDMFDFDDDGLLDKKEFEAYSQMSGSGPVNSEKWENIYKRYGNLQNCLTIRTFVEMHQDEVKCYETDNQLILMKKAIKELGHNSDTFFIGSACSTVIEFILSEEGSFSLNKFTVEELVASDELDAVLKTYFWEHGSPIPYNRDLTLLRQFKTDYFSVLIAKQQEESTHYIIDILISNVSVDIEENEQPIRRTSNESNNITIDNVVEANTLKILAIACAKSENWFISIKARSNDREALK